MPKLTIRKFSELTNRNYLACRSAVNRRGVVPCGSEGSSFLYWFKDLEEMFIRKPATSYYKKVTMEDERPEGSVTILEFVALTENRVKYHTVDIKLRRAGVASDGFIYRNSHKQKTYPLTKLKQLTGL